jgi:hypothetical protein
VEAFICIHSVFDLLPLMLPLIFYSDLAVNYIILLKSMVRVEAVEGIFQFVYIKVKNILSFFFPKNLKNWFH